MALGPTISTTGRGLSLVGMSSHQPFCSAECAVLMRTDAGSLPVRRVSVTRWPGVSWAAPVRSLSRDQHRPAEQIQSPQTTKHPQHKAGGVLGLGNGYTAGMRAALLIVCLVAVGCTGEPVKSTPRKSLADRRADAQATLSKTPTPRTYRIDGNELKVIDIPVVDASGLAEVQRCFVWRDQEFRSSTLSCGQMPEILIPRD